MQQRDFLDKRDNIMRVTLISLIVLSYFSSSIFALCFYYFLYSWAIGNVRRISGGVKALIIRRMVYFLPIFLPFVLLNQAQNLLRINFLGFVFVILASSFILFLRRNEIHLLFCKEFIFYRKQESLILHVISLIFLIGMSAAEELFYRGTVYLLLKDQFVLCFMASSILFFINHYSVLWANEAFDVKDYLYQFIFATISMISLVLTKSILPSILGHLMMNSPYIYSEFILIVDGLKKERR